MRVAFDVKGTIEGPKQDLVLKLFRGLQKQGHTCVVWSNMWTYAKEAIKTHNLTNTEADTKKSVSDLMNWGIPLFDLAIEDDREQGTYLGASEFIYVDELTEELIESILRKAS